MFFPRFWQKSQKFLQHPGTTPVQALFRQIPEKLNLGRAIAKLAYNRLPGRPDLV
jgi:hypothetical protein